MKNDIQEPSVTTYDRVELTVETGFTGTASEPTAGSDRNSKAGLRKVSSIDVLRKLEQMLRGKAL